MPARKRLVHEGARGLDESSFFLPGETGGIYATLYTSLSAQRSPPLLVAGPYGDEQATAQRVLVNLSRALSGRGFSVLRFDYPGLGESDGDAEQNTLESLARAAGSAAAELRRLTGASEIAWFGVRLGALLSSLAPGAPRRRVLLDPVTDGVAYVGELQLAAKIRTGFRDAEAELGQRALEAGGVRFGARLIGQLRDARLVRSDSEADELFVISTAAAGQRAELAGELGISPESIAHVSDARRFWAKRDFFRLPAIERAVGDWLTAETWNA
jgi:pimeloyl-ACP methyl ester carboxylesterase